MRPFLRIFTKSDSPKRKPPSSTTSPLLTTARQKPTVSTILPHPHSVLCAFHPTPHSDRGYPGGYKSEFKPDRICYRAARDRSILSTTHTHIIY